MRRLNENIHTALKRLLVEIQMLKALLGISQTEMKTITGKWRKGKPCYKVVENLAELCSAGWNKNLDT